MMCEKCKKNLATVYYKQTINGKTTEQNLCADCARTEDVESIFSQGLWSKSFPALFGAEPPHERVCKRCGTSERDLKHSGRVGCADCYEVFSDLLQGYLQRVQGAVQHIASPALEQQATQAEDKVEQLRLRLRQAIDCEDYEQAARLRDQIRGEEAAK